jgi:hypothetical protein
MESNHLPATPLNNGYRVTAGNGEQAPKLSHTLTNVSYKASWLDPVKVETLYDFPTCFIRCNFSHYKKCFILQAARSPHVYSAGPSPRYWYTSHFEKQKPQGF